MDASINSPKDYSPITLSGIVQQGDASVMTDLTVGFQFVLPYLTGKGTLTNLSIATGPSNIVNLILGLPFITQTWFDASNQVTKMCVFYAPPFPINFRRVMYGIPVVDKANVGGSQCTMKEKTRDRHSVGMCRVLARSGSQQKDRRLVRKKMYMYS
jgi:hypothetical protein